MAKITLTGTPAHTLGELPKVGDSAPSFSLTGAKLATVTQENYSGKKLVLNIFPSIDTNTCAASVRAFNKLAAELKDTVVLCISADLPFAQWRFCGAEGIGNVFTLSTFRDGGSFGKNFGVTMIDGPLEGLLARAVVVIDQERKVIHSELVSEINQEPDYQAALASLV